MSKRGKKLDDINVMPGIDFKSNQQRMQQFNQEHITINKLKLMQFIYISVGIIVLIIVGINTVSISKQAIDQCSEKHNRNYCIENL